MKDKRTISGIENKDLILINNYYNLNEITNPNIIGTITDDNTHEECGKITPLIMIINSSGKNWEKAVKSLVEVGADPDMMINYYGKNISAREIANTYRGGFPSV